MNLFGLHIKVGWLWIAFRTTWFVRLAGAAYGPFIFIKPKHWHKEGLLVHEVQHTRQFWSPWLWFKGKQWWEVNAYATEVNFFPVEDHRLKTLVFARYLANDYDFGLTNAKAYDLIENELLRIRNKTNL